ncbi:unnamed protein product [Staurois parvus]|uniref:Uncharacterized protein n=1 Tax=Staurois parvus TaxID=386267 RepID=A0ABN9DT06_9NEOB|nr:unnamed protein product [Staurois parvus]
MSLQKKKNPNMCTLIGLCESYSVYKWIYIYRHTYTLVMETISDL